MTPSTSHLSPDQQQEVRRQVRDLLGRTEAFADLEPDRRRVIANGLVDVLSYLSDPNAGLSDGDATTPDPQLLRLVQGQANSNVGGDGGANTDAQTSQKPDGKTAGDLLNATATRQAGDTFQQLTNAVDFPKFVSSLVHGVFDSIVDSSIKQMEAYSKFLEATVKSLNQFKDDHVSQEDARQSIVDRFPDLLSTSPSSGAITPLPGADDDQVETALAQMGVAGGADLDDEETQRQVIESERLRLARARQQQLATMVLLGINRIVVTNGYINAKVMIDVRATDSVHRTNTAGESSYARQSKSKSSKSGWGWGKRERERDVQTSVSSAYARSEDESESKIKTRANLTGQVRINFRSETFPLDKIGSPQDLVAVTEKSKRT